jgi:CRP/FNR family transcriptional regulator, cyclic AMP receptor protein
MKNDQPGFWGQLGVRDQNRLVTAGRIGQFPAGATICRQGEPAAHLFVLITGLVKVVTVNRDGQEAVLALRGDGDVVGELAGELTGYRTASMYAVTKVRAVVIAHEKFSAFLDGCPPADHAYRRMLTQRFSDTADSLYAQSTTSGAQRLARLLLELARRYGTPGPRAAGGERHVVIALPLAQEELASLASASRATVTRALHDWRERGLIQTGTRRTTIIDPAALRRLAGLDS